MLLIQSAPAEPTVASSPNIGNRGPANNNPNGVQHMVQLDGLRAFAVAAVVWYHWLPLRNFGLPLGPWGVHLFFVLSGFLITGILLDVRTACGDTPARWFGLRQFYKRRFLRIFPLFYAVLGLGVLFNIPEVRSTWAWHVSYLSNIYFFVTRAWNGHISHFWSLAVEEQFYLIWPFLVLFAPKRHLASIMLGVIALAPIFRLGMPCILGGNPFATYLTPGCSDCLGCGALLAYAERNGLRWLNRHTKFYLCLLGLAGTVVCVGFHVFSGLAQTFAALCFGWLVSTAANGFSGVSGVILQLRPVVYLGRISYGIYVLHLFSIDVLSFATRHLHVPWALAEHGLSRVPLLAAITIAGAGLSWCFFEKPINNLKRFVPYLRQVQSCSTELQPASPVAP